VYIARVKRFAEGTLYLAVTLLVVIPAAFAVTPTWAKKAVSFPSQCDADSTAPGATACRFVRIPSPDGKSKVEVYYSKSQILLEYSILQAHLLVTTPDGRTHDAALPEGFENIDLLWSPDSRAFFVNGGNGGAYWGFWVYAYVADDPAQPRDITEAAQRDMLKEFSPCKAAYPNGRDATGCKEDSRPLDLKTCINTEASPKYSPQYNMTGIDWLSASSILVMAEVPCSGSYGGIMCQVMGYEIEIPNGRILKRFDAKQLQLHWRQSMAWSFRVPEPPQYCK
jgi:hypothetical protein